MEAIQTIVISLQPPSHGWLPLRLQIGTFDIEVAASNVLNDPLGELIEGVAYCQSPNADGHRVCLWLEPDGYAIDFLPGAVPDRGVLRVSYGDLVPPMLQREKRQLFEGEADLGMARDALWSALAGFVERTDPAALEKWRPGQRYLNRLAALRPAVRP